MDSKTEKAREYIPQLRELGRRNKAWRSLITSMCEAFDAALEEKPEPCESCKFYEGCEHTFEHKPPLKDDAIGQAIDALCVNAFRFGNKELEAIAYKAHEELIAMRMGKIDEPEPCEDERFAKVARLIVARCLGSLEANPTYIEAVHTLLVQHFTSQIVDKSVEELRAQVDTLRHELTEEHKLAMDPRMHDEEYCDVCRALAATEPKT